MNWKVPLKRSEGLFEEKKSHFLSFVDRVRSREEFSLFLSEIKAVYPDARHWCSAFIVSRSGSEDKGFDDDGEPRGTAGKPLLNVLCGTDLTQVAVVVVRWFGGIKLGTGGLVRAYTRAAHLALENLCSDYPPIEFYVMSKMGESYVLESLLSRNSVAVIEREYEYDVKIFCSVKSDAFVCVRTILEEQGFPVFVTSASE